MIYQIVAFILLCIFYISYLLKNILLIKKQIKVNQLGKNKDDKKIKKFEKLLKIVTYTMVIVQVSSIIINDKWFIINIPPYFKIVGLIILMISVILFIISILTIKDNWRVGVCYDNQTKLVTNGIYKISRNPAFLSFDLLYIGLSIMFPNPINLLFTIVLIIMFDVQIRYEEKSLYIKFGNDYQEYCQKVKRYFLFF